MIDVDAQNLAEQLAWVLSGEVVVGVGSAVADGNVQHAVVAKNRRAAIVPFGRPFQDAFFAARIAHRFDIMINFIAKRYDKAREIIDADAPFGMRATAHEYLAVLAVVRMKL